MDEPTAFKHFWLKKNMLLVKDKPAFMEMQIPAAVRGWAKPSQHMGMEKGH